MIRHLFQLDILKEQYGDGNGFMTENMGSTNSMAKLILLLKERPFPVYFTSLNSTD